ncbi:hypothetical protein KSP40_PGU022089 [Platanthera guangdongensis]|uniref:Uncharacterized protein n=1 Tax=Platanthera guangdongensis TaxID=2320717 RepID=A0ABR2M1E2_9ASPA
MSRTEKENKQTKKLKLELSDFRQRCRRNVAPPEQPKKKCALSSAGTPSRPPCSFAAAPDARLDAALPPGPRPAAAS